ncbi:putative phospholipase B-like 2, partial [Saccoglossus kowalevskii]|uniref:Phospholipase B-like n=1 Tax=Saccoglossus kowalevskii TaxID=10224 RepID=A0ABM0MTK9_SACKO
MSTNMSRPFLIVFLVYTSVISSNYATKPIESRISSVILDEKSEKLVVVDQDVKNAVARANFTDDISQTGWSYLTVSTNPVYDDTIQAYAAGLVEGHITSTRIYQHWINTVYGFCKHPSDYCNRLEDFIKTNIAWMSEKIENNAKDPYWHQ